MLSIAAGVVDGVVVVSWNSCVDRCINGDFDVTDDVVEKAEQLLLIADRKREIARVLLVFMMIAIN